MRMDTAEKRAAKSVDYLAGLFDGEGSFSIQVSLRYYKADAPTGFVNPSMSVHLYYGHEVLNHFVSSFGGQIYTHKKGGRRWHLGGRAEVLSAAIMLQPHLEIKRGIATRFIEAVRMFPTAGTGAARKRGERVWTQEQVIAVAEIALTLNPPRSRKCSKTLEYINVLRESLTQGPIQ